MAAETEWKVVGEVAYREKRKECKWVVNVTKQEANWRYWRKLTEAFGKDRR